MNGQLQQIVDELRAAQGAVHRLHHRLAVDDWHRRPGRDRWSAAECVVHLNLTSAALIPLLHRALAEARRLETTRYRRNLVGWLVTKVMSAGSMVRIRTTMPFVPEVTGSLADVIDEFDRLQDEIVACVEAADGLALDRVFLVSPFHARLRYNVYAAMTLIARHQQRHVVQALDAAAGCEPLVAAVAV